MTLPGVSRQALVETAALSYVLPSLSLGIGAAVLGYALV
jgi:hypothetical protein